MTEHALRTTAPANQDYLNRLISGYLVPYRFLNYGRLTRLSKCIGFIGPRGSLKSLSASAMGILDYMIPGYKLVSNMEVYHAVNIRGNTVGYHSEELDKAAVINFDIEDRTALLVDEVNIEFSEARRSMTNRNLIFNKIMQQLRKRKLNLIYTVQHEMWIDSRLRWQTDFFIRTKDVCLMPGGDKLPYAFGEYGSWKIYDMSGFLGKGAYGDTGKAVIEDWRFHGKPWWNTYNTDEIQGIDEDPPAGKWIELKKSEYSIKEDSNQQVIRDTILDLHNQGVESIPSEDLYRMVGINPNIHNEKIYIGRILKSLGIVYQRWNKTYKIPDTDLDKPDTMNNNIVKLRN